MLFFTVQNFLFIIANWKPAEIVSKVWKINKVIDLSLTPKIKKKSYSLFKCFSIGRYMRLQYDLFIECVLRIIIGIILKIICTWLKKSAFTVLILLQKLVENNNYVPFPPHQLNIGKVKQLILEDKIFSSIMPRLPGFIKEMIRIYFYQ